MTSDDLIEDFKRLLRNPEKLNTGLEHWQKSCEAHLREVSEPDAHALLTEVQRLVRENRVLFEEESEGLLNSLTKQSSRASKAQARKYQDIDKL